MVTLRCASPWLQRIPGVIGLTRLNLACVISLSALQLHEPELQCGLACRMQLLALLFLEEESVLFSHVLQLSKIMSCISSYHLVLFSAALSLCAIIHFWYLKCKYAGEQIAGES